MKDETDKHREKHASQQNPDPSVGSMRDNDDEDRMGGQKKQAQGKQSPEDADERSGSSRSGDRQTQPNEGERRDKGPRGSSQRDDEPRSGGGQRAL